MFQSCHARSFQKKFYSTLGKVTNPKLKCVKPLTELWCRELLLWALWKAEWRNLTAEAAGLLIILFKWLLSGLWIDPQMLNCGWIMSLTTISLSPFIGQNTDMRCALGRWQLSVPLSVPTQKRDVESKLKVQRSETHFINYWNSNTSGF